MAFMLARSDDCRYREVCDKIEETVADEFWSLPKYREMLFLV